MNPSQIERITLSSIKDTSHLLYLQQEHDIAETHFAFFPDEAQYIYKYTRDYGEAPPAVILEANFPNFEYAPAENFEVLAAELRRSYESRVITLAYGNARRIIAENPTEAASYMMRTLSGITRPSTKQVVELSDNPLQWFDEYEKRVKQREDGEFLSIGLEPLDNRLFVSPGQFIGLLADWGVGKSYVAVKMAVKFYQQGQKVLFISPELSRSELMVRFHTILGRQWGYEFSATALTWGLPAQKEQYRKFLTELDEKKSESNQEIIVYDTGLQGNLNVGYVEGLIQKHEPDVVFIDSIQFVHDTSGVREGWMQMGKICEGLKQVASSNGKIIVATNQTNAAGDSAYSREFPRYVDILIRVSHVEDRITERNISVEKVRNGASITDTLPVVFDPDTGYVGDSVWSTTDSLISDDSIS